MNDFPTDFTQLPDVSFVIPNQDNDMHNGLDPAKITRGDTWIKDHLQTYIDWAQTNNSLFILTFDESITIDNQVMCFFIGPMVMAGDYSLKGYNHYDLLHTLEDMYDLPHAANSINADPIEEIWLVNHTDVAEVEATFTSFVYPNPLTDDSQILITNNQKTEGDDLHLLIYDFSGTLRIEEILQLKPGKSNYVFRREGLSGGSYTYQLVSDQKLLGTGKVIVE
jgi:hypothetical protein